jgi:hypothetical protein
MLKPFSFNTLQIYWAAFMTFKPLHILWLPEWIFDLSIVRGLLSQCFT